MRDDLQREARFSPVCPRHDPNNSTISIKRRCEEPTVSQLAIDMAHLAALFPSSSDALHAV
jgi:hypothetical protein